MKGHTKVYLLERRSGPRPWVLSVFWRRQKWVRVSSASTAGWPGRTACSSSPSEGSNACPENRKCELRLEPDVLKAGSWTDLRPQLWSRASRQGLWRLQRLSTSQWSWACCSCEKRWSLFCEQYCKTIFCCNWKSHKLCLILMTGLRHLMRLITSKLGVNL